MVDYETLIPVNVITGFLGSGKTTLLQRLLASPRLSNTAVLINEFGEVALDHLLLERLDEETIVLQGGCVCCTIRSDLTEAIRDLYGKRERGDVPPFERLAIETTGLADPAPVVFTFMADPVIRHHFRLGNTIATIDAVNGPLHLEQNPESVKQVLVADRLALTKTDISGATQARKTTARLRRLNPSAPIIETSGGDFDPDDLLMSDIYDADRKIDEVRRWLSQSTTANEHDDHAGHDTDINRHGERIHAFCLTYDEPVDWTAFGIWLTMLLHRHGENVLRVKGILNVLGLSAPVVIHGVQHVVHPPSHLERWPDMDRRSRIVFIVRDLQQRDLERSLAAFNRLGDTERSAT
jgi:G3E family GTPase